MNFIKNNSVLANKILPSYYTLYIYCAFHITLVLYLRLIIHIDDYL